jgi:hypothetical protein
MPEWHLLTVDANSAYRARGRPLGDDLAVNAGRPGVFKGDLHYYASDGDVRARLSEIDIRRCPLRRCRRELLLTLSLTASLARKPAP